jgi:carbonic anhydrase/acetyltransferase-like protein (isoleucine patch superfamily)
MTIYKINGDTPEIHESVFVAREATVIGRVKLGANVSVWPGVVIRADNDHIEIGDESNLQDP